MPLDTPTYQQIIDRIRADVKSILPDLDPTIFESLISGITDSNAGRHYDNVLSILQLVKELFPDTAIRENLERWAAYEGIVPFPALQAAGNAVFTGAIGTTILINREFNSGLNYTYIAQQTVEIAEKIITLSSLTNDGLTAIALANEDFPFATNTEVTIENAGVAEYNGSFPIVMLSARKFQYTLPSLPSGPATGGTYENLLLWSEALDNAVWIKGTDVTITPDNIAAPDGSLTADRVNIASSGFRNIRQIAAISTANSFIALSRFVKKGTIDNVRLAIGNTSLSNQFYAQFDLTNGVAGPIVYIGAASDAISSIEPYGDDWYRCIIIGKANGGDTDIRFELSAAIAGNYYSWGAQGEESETAHTYAKTEATTVTVTDINSKANAAVVPVNSDLTGADKNLDSGATLTFASQLSGADLDGFVDLDGITGGRDLETTESLYRRTVQSRSNPVANFNEAAITKQMLLVEGVTRTLVKRITPAIGQVTSLFVRDDDDDIIPSAAEVTDVNDSILEILPAQSDPSDVITKAPTPVTTNYDFASITPNTATMKAAIEENLIAFYEDEVTFETTITEKKYNSAIVDTIDAETGDRLTDFTLNSPSGDIVVTTDEIGILGTVTFV